MSIIRMAWCAGRGHIFPNGNDGTCTRCGLTIHPPKTRHRQAA